MTITDGKPEGYTTLTPFLVCSPARDAITFYEEVFGATVVSRMDGPGDTVMHAELDLGDGRLQLSDPNEQYGLVVPDRSSDSVSGSTCIYVADVDAVFAKAVERGRHGAREAGHLRHRRPLRLDLRPVRPPLGGHDQGRGRQPRGSGAAAVRVGVDAGLSDSRGSRTCTSGPIASA